MLTSSTNQRSSLTTPEKTAPKSSAIAEEIESKFGQFINTLSNTLNDFTALEVNTMVVSKITGAKFHPMDAYESLYHQCIHIEKASQNPGVAYPDLPPAALWPQYLKLFEQLRSAYRRCPAEAKPSDELPNPDHDAEFEALMDLMKIAPFVRTLRKLAELRAALDGGNIASKQTDLIYAQTIMQLDGDVINRYHENLFNPDNLARREIILQIHNEGVKAGERQWRGLIQFMVDFLQNFLGSVRK